MVIYNMVAKSSYFTIITQGHVSNIRNLAGKCDVARFYTIHLGLVLCHAYLFKQKTKHLS